MRESRSEHEKSALSQPKLPCQVIASLCPWIPSSPGRERESTEAVANWRAKMTIFTTVGCDRNRMPFLSKASNVVQNVFFLYDVTGFTQIRRSIPVATSCTDATGLMRLGEIFNLMETQQTQSCQSPSKTSDQVATARPETRH